MTLRPIPLLLAACVFAAVGAPSRSMALSIDKFTDPLPSHPLLPVMQLHILFLGSRCDSSNCVVPVTNPNSSDLVSQTGLTGAVGGRRTTELRFGPVAPTPPFNAGMAFFGPPIGGMEFANTTLLSFEIVLRYGDAAHPLGLDLTADGSDRFEFESYKMGDFTVELESYDDLGQLVGASQGVSVANDDFLRAIPFAALVGNANLHDVDAIRLVIHTLNDDMGGIPYTTRYLHKFRTAGVPVPASNVSWGRLKGDYRR
jgi:hypothetical protein